MKFTAAALTIAVVSAADEKKPETTATTCGITKVEHFTDDKCTKVDAAKDKAYDKAALKAYSATIKISAKCTDSGDGKKFVKTFCDKDGFGTKAYTDKECKTEDTAKDAQAGYIVWGTCVANTKYTDAKFISAGLVAAAAMIASQF